MTAERVANEQGQPGVTRAWRPALRRDVAVLLLLKAAALALLWWMFFSPPHRTPVDATAAGRHLALERPAGVSPDRTLAPSGEQP